MNEIGIILVTIAIAVVATDIVIRLWLAPHRRDRWTETLLDSLIESESADRPAGQVLPATACLDDVMGESLLRHFEQSATSRHVLAALAFRRDGLPESEVFAVVNQALASARKRELPATVLRKVVMVLMGANLAALRQGKFKLTVAGKRLHALLEVRSVAPLPSYAFASRAA